MNRTTNYTKGLVWVLVGLAIAVLTVGAAWAGAYLFAGEANGPDLITHPQGYTGSETSLSVEVCIDPASLVPAGASINDLEIPVKNNIDVWNRLRPGLGNTLLDTANNIPAGLPDFESVSLHEIGHCIGLAHVNAASESGLPLADQNYTKATDGANNVFDINSGTDGVRGTSDDIRGDDANLHWFRIDTNDPGQLPLPSPIDTQDMVRKCGRGNGPTAGPVAAKRATRPRYKDKSGADQGNSFPKFLLVHPYPAAHKQPMGHAQMRSLRRPPA